MQHRSTRGAAALSWPVARQPVERQAPFASDPSGRGEPSRRRLLRDALLLVLGQATKVLLQLAGLVLLARLLSPEAFGLMAVVAAVTGLLSLVLGLGLTPAIIQAERLSLPQLSTLYWLNLGFALVLMLVVVGVAPVLAFAFADSRLGPIALVSALVLPMTGAAMVHRALLLRRLRVAELLLIDVASLGAALSIALGMAVAGAGVWSLVAMPPVQALLQLLAIRRACGWQPGRPVRGAGVRALLRFGGNLLGVAVVNHLARQVDKLAIGMLYGPVTLGHYARAYQLYLLPASLMLQPLYDVLVPMLSRLVPRRDRFAALFAGALGALSWLAAAFAVVMLLYPAEIVGIALGAQWAPAVPILRQLAPAIVALPLLSVTGWVLTSLGEGRRYWRLTRLTALLQSGAILVVLPLGAEAVALAIAVTTFAASVPLALRALRAARPALGVAALWAVGPPLLSVLSIALVRVAG